MRGRLKVPSNQRRTYKQCHFYGYHDTSLPELASEVKSIAFPYEVPVHSNCDYNPLPNGLAKLALTAHSDTRKLTLLVEDTAPAEPLPPGGIEEVKQAAWVEQRTRSKPRRRSPRPDIPEWNAKLSTIRRLYNQNFRPRNLKPTARTAFKMYKDNPLLEEAFSQIDSELKTGFPAPRSLIYHAAYLARQDYPAKAITEAMERLNDVDEAVRKDIEQKMETLYQEIVHLIVQLIAGEI